MVLLLPFAVCVCLCSHLQAHTYTQIKTDLKTRNVKNTWVMLSACSISRVLLMDFLIWKTSLWMYVYNAFLCSLPQISNPLHQPLIRPYSGTVVSCFLSCFFSSFLFLSLLPSSPQGTLNNQTGIFPQSFVKIIKPLPDSDTEGESEGHTYSCLRCFLLTPSGVDTRSVCVYVCVFMTVIGDLSEQKFFT